MIDYKDSKYDCLPNNSKILIVTDTNVAPLYLNGLHNTIKERGCIAYDVILPAGEGSKTLSNAEEIYEVLAENTFSRSDYVIALGGGMITDISGFCAATYNRGMKYISIPTTLLAMVDAAHGGKCGVDLECGKNLVGAFYEPEQVIIDVDYLDTLNEEYLTDGMAEVIKYAFIMDKSLYEQLLDLDECDLRNESVILKCIVDKQSIVMQDKKDFGIRRILNFGHTIGHALEQISGYRISHGRAVAVGMVKICEMAFDKGLCDKSVCDALKSIIGKFNLPTDYSQLEAIGDIFETELKDKITQAMALDKKHDGEIFNVVVITAIGVAKIISYEELL